MTSVAHDHPAAARSGASPVRVLESREPITVQVIVQPEPGPRDRRLALSHHDAAILASRLADDLSLATWEDAEWR